MAIPWSRVAAAPRRRDAAIPWSRAAATPRRGNVVETGGRLRYPPPPGPSAADVDANRRRLAEAVAASLEADKAADAAKVAERRRAAGWEESKGSEEAPTLRRRTRAKGSTEGDVDLEFCHSFDGVFGKTLGTAG